MAVFVLDEMQMFDQQIAPARPIGQKRLDFLQRLKVDLPALRRARRTPATAGPVATGRRLDLHIHGCPLGMI